MAQQKTQLRLRSITGSFGEGLDQIQDTLEKSPILGIESNDISGIFSHLASSIKRIHGGEEFSNMEAGQFKTDLVPSINGYSLGNEEKKWLNLNLISGSISSEIGGKLKFESDQLIFSSSILSNESSHKFEGVGIELESLFPSQAEYAAVGKVQDVMYNVGGSLYFGSTLLNAPYEVIKEVVKVSSEIPSNSSLISNSSYTGIDMSSLPSSNRNDLVEVYHNGQLLVGGTSEQIIANEADYYMDVTSITSVDFKFSFSILADDIITIVSKYVSASAASADFDKKVSQNFKPQDLLEGEYSGEVVTFGSGSLSAGSLYYLNGSSWVAADNTDVTKGSDAMLAIAIGTSPSEGMLVKGYYRPNTTILSDFSGGKALFVGGTAGYYSTVSPDSADSFSRIIGYCIDSSNIIYFSPENGWLELS